jgi:hypothetical protein
MHILVRPLMTATPVNRVILAFGFTDEEIDLAARTRRTMLAAHADPSLSDEVVYALSVLWLIERPEQDGGSWPADARSFVDELRDFIHAAPANARQLLPITERRVRVEQGSVIPDGVPSSSVTKIKLRRVRSPRYRIAEMVVGMNPDATLTEEQRAWQEAPPTGREVW